MNAEGLVERILTQALGTTFAIFQAVLLASLFAVAKTVVDSRQHKRDLNAAFKAIRRLETRVCQLQLERAALLGRASQTEVEPEAGDEEGQHVNGKHPERSLVG